MFPTGSADGVNKLSQRSVHFSFFHQDSHEVTPKHSEKSSEIKHKTDPRVAIQGEWKNCVYYHLSSLPTLACFEKFMNFFHIQQLCHLLQFTILVFVAEIGFIQMHSVSSLVAIVLIMICVVFCHVAWYFLANSFPHLIAVAVLTTILSKYCFHLLVASYLAHHQKAFNRMALPFICIMCYASHFSSTMNCGLALLMTLVQALYLLPFVDFIDTQQSSEKYDKQIREISFRDWITPRYFFCTYILWTITILGVHYVVLKTSMTLKESFIWMGHAIQLRAQVRNKVNHEKLLFQSLVPPSLVSKFALMESANEDNKRPFYAEIFPEVSILVLHFRNFRKLISGPLRRQKLICLTLVELFECLDAICLQMQCQPLKSIHGEYLCISGCPVMAAQGKVEGAEGTNHAVIILNVAQRILFELKRFASSMPGRGWVYASTYLGIHSGKVVAAMIGQTQVQFDVYSLDVMTAKQVARTGKKGYIHVTQDVFNALGNFTSSYTFTESMTLLLNQQGDMVEPLVEGQRNMTTPTSQESQNVQLIRVSTLFVFTVMEQRLGLHHPKLTSTFTEQFSPSTGTTEVSGQNTKLFDRRATDGPSVGVSSTCMKPYREEAKFVEHILTDKEGQMAQFFNPLLSYFTLNFCDAMLEADFRIFYAQYLDSSWFNVAAMASTPLCFGVANFIYTATFMVCAGFTPFFSRDSHTLTQWYFCGLHAIFLLMQVPNVLFSYFRLTSTYNKWPQPMLIFFSWEFQTAWSFFNTSFCMIAVLMSFHIDRIAEEYIYTTNWYFNVFFAVVPSLLFHGSAAYVAILKVFVFYQLCFGLCLGIVLPQQQPVSKNTSDRFRCAPTTNNAHEVTYSSFTYLEISNCLFLLMALARLSRQAEKALRMKFSARHYQMRVHNMAGSWQAPTGGDLMCAVLPENLTLKYLHFIVNESMVQQQIPSFRFSKSSAIYVGKECQVTLGVLRVVGWYQQARKANYNQLLQSVNFLHELFSIWDKALVSNEDFRGVCKVCCNHDTYAVAVGLSDTIFTEEADSSTDDTNTDVGLVATRGLTPFEDLQQVIRRTSSLVTTTAGGDNVMLLMNFLFYAAQSLKTEENTSTSSEDVARLMPTDSDDTATEPMDRRRSEDTSMGFTRFGKAKIAFRKPPKRSIRQPRNCGVQIGCALGSVVYTIACLQSVTFQLFGVAVNQAYELCCTSKVSPTVIHVTDEVVRSIRSKFYLPSEYLQLVPSNYPSPFQRGPLREAFFVEMSEMQRQNLYKNNVNQMEDN